MEKACIAVGLSRSDVRKIALSAPHRYKVYTIPKRNGGVRVIAHPSRELKAIQYFLIKEILSQLPVHPSAAAYVPAKNIMQNAYIHKDSQAILKLDFSAFFPSIVPRDLLSVILENCIHLTKEDALFISQICFWKPIQREYLCLSIGAPSSPIISNVVMMKFDTDVSAYAVQNGLRYTRYADDVTISGDSTSELVSAEAAIRKIVRRMRSPILTINEDKRGMYTRGQRRMVTGLIITPDANVSVGRSRKRAASACVHKYKLGLLDVDQAKELQGTLAFIDSVEPNFTAGLCKKYGTDVIKRIRKM